MNLICWNCRGTASKGFVGLVKDMKREYSASFIALLETHTSGNQAKKIAKRMGFEHQFIVDARGQAGGIWLIWDSVHCPIQILRDTTQLVHVKVSPSNASPWFSTIVYGSPHYANRQILWDDIQDIHSSIDSPWALLGDFNVVLHDYERAALIRAHPIEAGFQATLDRCNLFDLGYNGDLFTWARGNTRKHLDRAICNLDWHLRFEHSEITHLPKLKSDHSPLLLNLEHRRYGNRRRKPFRFEAIWLTHPISTILLLTIGEIIRMIFLDNLRNFKGF